LFTLGVTVALRPLNKMPWDVPLAITVKLLVHPVLALTLLSLLGPFTEIWIYTAVLMAALPPALNVFVFARQYGVWVEQASSAVLFGTLISVATLTTVMWMVKTHQLPNRASPLTCDCARYPRLAIVSSRPLRTEERRPSA
jgi:malonate transporter and related proteins